MLPAHRSTMLTACVFVTRDTVRHPRRFVFGKFVHKPNCSWSEAFVNRGLTVYLYIWLPINLYTLLCFWILSIVLLLIKNPFGNWILSLFSGRNLLSRPQSIELAPISGYQHKTQDRIHKPSARVKTNMTNIFIFALTLADGLCCGWFVLSCVLCFFCTEKETSSIDWAQLSRFSPEDGDRIQFSIRYFE
jgi:hypothetical protein